MTTMVSGWRVLIPILAACFPSACSSDAATLTPVNDAGLDGGGDAVLDTGGLSSPWSLQALPIDPARLGLASLNDMAGAGPDRYIVGMQALLLHSTDEGKSWSNIGPRTGIPDPDPFLYPIFSSITVNAIDDVWVVAVIAPGNAITPFESRLLRSLDLGATWQSVVVGGARPIDVWAATRTRVVVLGLDGEIWRTADSGTTWTRVFADPAMSMSDVWGTSTTDVYVVGEAGTGGFMLHSADAGVTWEPVFTDAPCVLWHVAGTPDGRVVHATGACGSQARTENHGASWLRTGSGVALNDSKYALGGVWVSPSGTPHFPVAQAHPMPGWDFAVCNWLLASDTQFAPQACTYVPSRQEANGVRLSARPNGIWGTSDTDVWAFGPAGLLWRKR
jgi:photosystem II stability/assembly factor-like uncharacterized protein